MFTSLGKSGENGLLQLMFWYHLQEMDVYTRLQQLRIQPTVACVLMMEISTTVHGYCDLYA